MPRAVNFTMQYNYDCRTFEQTYFFPLIQIRYKMNRILASFFVAEKIHRRCFSKVYYVKIVAQPDTYVAFNYFNIQKVETVFAEQF
jgi:hypothetical protein